MTGQAWHEEAITRKHDRGTFDCGDPALNVFLTRHARQSHDNGGAKTFLAIDDDTRALLGFIVWPLPLLPGTARRRPCNAAWRGTRSPVFGWRASRSIGRGKVAALAASCSSLLGGVA